MTEARRVGVSQLGTAIAKGTTAGTADLEVLFTAPIDLLAGDILILEMATGTLTAIYREKRLIWKLANMPIVIQGTMQIDPEGQEYLNNLIDRKQRKGGVQYVK